MGCKEVDFFVSMHEIMSDAMLAVGFAASRGVDGAAGYDRKAMTEGDSEVTSRFAPLVMGNIRRKLGRNAVRVAERMGGFSITVVCRAVLVDRLVEEAPMLIRSAAAGYVTAAWERVTSPQEAEAAESFADRQLESLLSIFQEPGARVCRRPLSPI